MTKPSATVSRQYHSPTRERQASITRSNIPAAAERLLTSRGYAKTTIEAIAREAGVSTQTVYAVFGSKRGILAAILDEKLDNNDALFEIYQNSLQTTDVYEALRLTVDLIRRVCEIQSPVYELLRGAGVLDPELALINKAREKINQERADEHIRNILNNDPVHHLKRGMNPRMAQDIFWCLCNRDIYRILVQERGWTAETYADWLYDMLVGSLFEREEG